MQPLVKTARNLFEKKKNSFQGAANKGLWFERFYDGYTNSFTVEKTSDAQQLRDLVGLCGNKEQIEAAAERRIALTNKLNGACGVFSTDWHFITGMGNAHPTENGFSWHHTLGTPYLSGASVKGLLRAWMETWMEGQSEKVERWFGCNEELGKDGKAGELIFFEALPVEQPKVMLDIMTPHMGKWYEQGGENITPESQPGDWHSPVPINFLVTEQARFVFSIAARTEKAQGEIEEAFEYLKQALAWLGAGAKTAAGYGHMSFDEQDTLKRFKKVNESMEEAEQAEAFASLSEEEQQIEKIRQRVYGGEAKGQGAGSVLAGDLAAICDLAKSWDDDSKATLLDVAKDTCKHLNINAKKNGKWRDRLKALK